MIFSWDELNREHVAAHFVALEEAEYVVEYAKSPFPRAIGDGKHMVWGSTSAGRFLQVIFAFKSPDEVAYESVPIEVWANIGSEKSVRIVRVVHAMELTNTMKRNLRRRKR